MYNHFIYILAAVIAPHNVFDEDRACEALCLLGNCSGGDLACAYRGQPAKTWDYGLRQSKIAVVAVMAIDWVTFYHVAIIATRERITDRDVRTFIFC